MRASCHAAAKAKKHPEANVSAAKEFPVGIYPVLRVSVSYYIVVLRQGYGNFFITCAVVAYADNKPTKESKLFFAKRVAKRPVVWV
jgi:hypothetical protein